MRKMLLILIICMLGCQKGFTPQSTSDCIKDTKISWKFPKLDGKVGFKIYHSYDGGYYESIKTIEPSLIYNNKTDVQVDRCKSSNYFYVEAFSISGDIGRSRIYCFGSSCSIIVTESSKEIYTTSDNVVGGVE